MWLWDTVAVVMATVMVVVAGDGDRVVSGQLVCPDPVPSAPSAPAPSAPTPYSPAPFCYKMAYFRSVSSRVSFFEAVQACDTDGGSLLSIETQEEQRTIEDLLKGLRSGAGSESGIADGDFWIGLTRSETSDQTQNSSCSLLYQWTDGSPALYRNWYEDEPSCGGEACVVMYHQPTALPGLGGAYLHQWNDDRCNMKHNFICKYSTDPRLKEHNDSPGSGRARESESEEKETSPEIGVATNSGLLVLFVLMPTLPLLLLILVASATCCCQRLTQSKPRSKTPVDQSNLWISPSPKADV